MVAAQDCAPASGSSASTATTKPRQLSDAGVAGLCQTARDFALRLAGAGLRVSLWDESAAGLEEFVAGNAATRGGLVGYSDAEDFVESLNTPRRVVVFETGSCAPAFLSSYSGQAHDRVLRFPVCEDPVPPAEIELLWMSLFCELA